MALSDFEIDRADGVLWAWNPTKRAKKGGGDTDNPLEARIAMRVEVSEILAKLDGLFPGADLMAKRISAEDARGVEIKARKKVLDVTVTVCDSAGKTIIAPFLARGSAPVLVVSKGGADAEMRLTVKAKVGPDVWQVLRDYFQADVLISIVPSQSDLVIEEKKRQAAAGRPPLRQRDAFEDDDEDLAEDDMDAAEVN